MNVEQGLASFKVLARMGAVALPDRGCRRSPTSAQLSAFADKGYYVGER